MNIHTHLHIHENYCIYGCKHSFFFNKNLCTYNILCYLKQLKKTYILILNLLKYKYM